MHEWTLPRQPSEGGPVQVQGKHALVDVPVTELHLLMPLVRGDKQATQSDTSEIMHQSQWHAIGKHMLAPVTCYGFAGIDKIMHIILYN